MSFVELALEAEKLCKENRLEDAIIKFKQALTRGTTDPVIKTAVYAQVGNAYFYLQQFTLAREYHEKELELARAMGDSELEANALGNLGNTMRSLCLFDEATGLCRQQLQLWRELGKRNGEARALYNLGNIFHNKAKSDLGGISSPDAQKALNEAITYYEYYLAIVKAMGDVVSMGKAYGNLGNAHYRLGSYETSVQCHKERLTIAKSQSDKQAERRAYTNLGNSYIFLENNNEALDCYQNVRSIAQSMSELAVEAQACYCLGATSSLMSRFKDAIKYYIEHLHIAQRLADRIGEGRAYWALGNAHKNLGNKDRAAFYTKRHLDISREIGDEEAVCYAEETLLQLETASEAPSSPCHSLLRRRRSMEHLDLLSLTPRTKDKKKNPFAAFFSKEKQAKAKPEQRKSSVEVDKENAEDMFDMLDRVQRSRINEQRSDQKLVAKKEDIEELLAAITGTNNSNRRLENQRVSLAELQEKQQHQINQSQSDSNLQKIQKKLKKEKKKEKFADDEFFESLLKGAQSGRLDEQRSAVVPGVRSKRPQVRTIPDEDFFTNLLKYNK